MDLDRVLKELHRELDQLDAAIVSLERIMEAGKKDQAAGQPPRVRTIGTKRAGPDRQVRAKVPVG